MATDRPRFLSLLSVLALALWLVAACATSPTGRSQLIMMSEYQMAEMGRAAFADLKGQGALSTDETKTAYVRCVATAITNVLQPEEVQGLAITSWEVEVFEDPSANAFALPGGSIGVHTGMLDVAQTPDQLASVLGHEVAHVLARHGNERVSQSTLAQTGMELAQVLAGADTPARQQLFGLLGVGVQVGVLMPFSRTQESEADALGLTLMARAGFDPREAVKLWQNMEAAASGPSPPEILSTHPSHGTRITRLQEGMSEAMPIYERARAAGRVPRCR